MSAGAGVARAKDWATCALALAERGVRGSARRLEMLPSVTDFLFLQYEQALGTAVHATPVFEALRRAVPGATITVACSRTAHAVLRANPFIDGLVATPDPYEHFLPAALAMRRAWQPPAGRTGCIVTTFGSTRTKIALLGMLAGEAIRLGFTIAPRLYHKPIAYDRDRSQIDNNLRIIEALGHDYVPCEPRVFFTADDLATARRLLADGGLSEGTPRAVLVTQVSGGQRTRWRDERFVAVADRLAARHGFTVVFVGTADEAVAIDRLRQRLKAPTVSFAGKTSIPVLAALFCLCDLAVALDTGPMHVARAAGVPMAVIAPAWQSAIEWLPLGQERCTVLRGPDIQSMPPDYWIDEVTVDQVVGAIGRLTERFPASPESRNARIRRNLARPRC